MPCAHHTPERSCVACRRKRPQDQLIRVTRTETGWALLDGARTGRGAYVCADSPECWKEKRLGRAFRGQAGEIVRALESRVNPPPASREPPLEGSL